MKYPPSLKAEGMISRSCDQWDAVLMKYFAGREGEPPWYWISPTRQKRMAYYGLWPEDMPQDEKTQNT